jgi:acyl transferase domain-containing protein/NADPH:quinone reductase-like Zn-dependent oxidoreductase/NAD(P)-dependent dehydrogenase (short-subunit alcohol dehydrogenase family)/acyl carrier protein
MNDALTERRQLSPLKQALLKLEEMQAKLENVERSAREPIAIIGMGCRFPGGASTPEAFWRILREGVDAVTEIPNSRWNVEDYYDAQPGLPGKMVTRWGGVLEGIDLFDPQFFGIAPREAVSLDPQQRLLLEVSWEALENAGEAPDKLSCSQTGVFIGACKSDYLLLQLKQNNPALYDVYFASGNAHSVMSGRLSYVLGLQGPSITIDTACSSSLVAVHLACQSLRSGECDMALAGGVNVILSPENTISFSKASMLAADGRCKTFDAGADGFVQGEGCGIIVLKRLSVALADNNRILALVRGSAVNQDGPSSGLTAPNGPSQTAVIRQALSNAGLRSSQISYVETHGTATSLGDPIEVQALGEALCHNRENDAPLMIGSVKTNIGHLETAAGIASLIKVVLALQHREIPPHLHLKKLNPFVRWEELPMVIPAKPTPWPSYEGSRFAGISSFGFSGTNAHIVLEETPESDSRSNAAERPLHLFTLSGKNEAALKNLCSLFYGHLTEHPEERLADVCFTANAGRAHFTNRLAAVVETSAELIQKLKSFIEGQPAKDVVIRKTSSGDRPKVAFLFTGQGSQYAGMGRALFETQPVFHNTMQQCDEILRPHLGQPLLSVLYPEMGLSSASNLLLDQTGYAQPALFALEYSLARLWESWGIVPSAVMGHSLGEYVAACLAGVFSLEDGLGLVSARSRLMQALPPGGRMAAVFTNERRAAEIIGARTSEISIAAVNGPESVVISGDGQAVEAVLGEFAINGIGCKPLNVSHAFHSQLMEPMLDEFERLANSVRYSTPTIRIISNVSGKSAIGGDVTSSAYWKRHIRQPVQFHTSIQTLYDQGYRIFIEIGPHPVLLGMGASCLANGDEIWIPSLRRDRDDWHQMLFSLGQVYGEGADVDWLGFDKNYQRQRLALPTYPFAREHHWIDLSQQPAPVESPLHLPAQTLSHPLLGHRLNTPLADTIFTTHLSTEALPFLADHVVHGQVVFPATAYLEMVTAAGSELFGSEGVTIEDLVILEALLLSTEQSQLVELILSTGQKETVDFRLFSLVDDSEAARWKMHASGKILSPAVRQPEPGTTFESFAAIKARCTQRIEIDEFYRGLRARGLEFGPTFRGIEALWRSDGEAFAQVRLPLSAQAFAERYRVHPALLDACIQATAAAIPGFDPGDSQSDIYMPVGLDRFQYCDRVSDQLFSHVLIDPSGRDHQETMKLDAHVFDKDGKIIAQVLGLHLKRIDPEALLQLGRVGINEWLYEVAWVPRGLGVPENQASPYLLDPAQVVERTAPLLPEFGARLGAGIYDSLNSDLDALCAAYIVSGFRQMGFEFILNKAIFRDTLARELNVADHHYQLLGRLLRILSEEGLLAEQADGWQVQRHPSQTDPNRLCDELIRKYRNQDLELKLLRRCGEEIAALLKGEADPLQCLFPGGNLELVAKIYRETPLAITMNTVVKEVVRTAISQIPEPLRIQILEVGAGTGGTTTHVLPVLPAGRTDYVFTDIGQTFLTQAARMFSDYTFLEYKVLDIEKDPLQQGFTPHQFDLVIASNVLHATTNLSKTLAHIKQLLAPEGLLLLVEATRQLRWYDLTFGFTDGWWKFTDLERRSSSPLLDQRQWQDLLRSTGFSSPVTIPEAGSTGPLADNAVIVARGPRIEHYMPVSPIPHVSGLPQKLGYWIIFADHGGLGEQLAALLRTAGHRCHLVSPGTSYGFVGEDQWTLNPTILEDFHRLWGDTMRSTGLQCRGVVHLWATEDMLAADASESQLLHIQNRGCRSVLYALQTAIKEGGIVPPDFWLVTRGIHPVGDDKVKFVPAHAPIWGLGKVIALEHSDLKCVCIDLDDSEDTRLAQSLFSELMMSDSENQVAFRHNRRYVARLVRSKGSLQSADRQHSFSDSPRRLEIAGRGTIDGLELMPAERRAPGPGEIEICVRATGLNFRDVLNVLGMREDPEPLGGECAGTIAAVGQEVDGFQVGDEVVAITQGAFSTLVTAGVDLVAPKPKCMGFEEAAALPLAFLTAYYALHLIGNLRRGERVLIHAAAGGVGLAAVQLAMLAGAEIFATAGNPQKRAYLESLGIRHVMDSRTLEFADMILAQTKGEGLDVVLNTLTDEKIPKSLALLRANGRFLEIGKSQVWTRQQAAEVNPKASYIVVDLAEKLLGQPRMVKPMFLELMTQFEQGTLKSMPIKVFSLEQASDAFRYMARAKHIGKIVISQPGNTEAVAATVAGDAKRFCFRPDGTYLITGGLSGLGLQVAQWMVANGARSLVLMGRSRPSRTALGIIEDMHQMGATIVDVQGDVSVEQDVGMALAQISSLGLPLRGVVHCAGVLDDGVLQQQQWSRFQNVMAPKILGAWILHRMTLEAPLDFFVLFSSISAIFGSAGQANHAGANAFLDALAHYRRSHGLPGLSINWGAWSDIGAANKHNVSRRITAQGVGTIRPEAALQALSYSMQSGAAQMAVSPVNWHKFLSQVSFNTIPPFYLEMLQESQQRQSREKRLSATKVSGMAPIPGLRDHLAVAMPSKRRSLLMADIQAKAIQALGIDPSTEVDRRQPLSELGLDSLMAVELRNALGTALSLPLPATLLFDYSSIEKLTDYLFGLLFGSEVPKEASSATVQTQAETGSYALSDIENLSDDEIDALFNKRMEKQTHE